MSQFEVPISKPAGKTVVGARSAVSTVRPQCELIVLVLVTVALNVSPAMLVWTVGVCGMTTSADATAAPATVVAAIAAVVVMNLRRCIVCPFSLQIGDGRTGVSGGLPRPLWGVV